MLQCVFSNSVAKLLVQAPSADSTKEDEQSKDKKPLLSKSAVLRLLAELSRSYAGCAVLICQHTYHAGQSELITEVCLLFVWCAFFLFFCWERPYIIGPMHSLDIQNLLEAFASLRRDLQWIKAQTNPHPHHKPRRKEQDNESIDIRQPVV